MRLGQIARKYDLKPTQVRDFIQNRFKVTIDLDLNTKLEDSHVEAIEKKFENLAENGNPVTTHVPAEVAEQVKLEQEIVAGTLAEPAVLGKDHSQPAADQETSGDGQSTELTTEEGKVIDPFTPLPVDPDAELIKAPKIKLDGPKVVGKIELPAKKTQEAGQEGENADNETRPKGKRSSGSRNQEDDEEYSIYKDKYGVYHFSQQQRQNRKASLERIKRERQEEERKRAKENYYRQIVKPESEAVIAKKKKRKEQINEERVRKTAVKPAPKGLWGKFIHWLNG